MLVYQTVVAFGEHERIIENKHVSMGLAVQFSFSKERQSSFTLPSLSVDYLYDNLCCYGGSSATNVLITFNQAT